MVRFKVNVRGKKNRILNANTFEVPTRIEAQNLCVCVLVLVSMSPCIVTFALCMCKLHVLTCKSMGRLNGCK